jgi:hypothetical protein
MCFKLSPLENLEVDSIKGISKWKSNMETDINFSDSSVIYILSQMIRNSKISSTNFFIELYRQTKMALAINAW